MYRSLVRLCTGALMIPLFTNLARPLDCGRTWLASGLTCFAGGHAAVVSLSMAMYALVGALVLAGKHTDTCILC